jgi:hypothetical protein
MLLRMRERERERERKYGFNLKVLLCCEKVETETEISKVVGTDS